jgi:DNA polymerase-1
MKYVLLGDDTESVQVAILIKETALHKQELLNNYVLKMGLDPKFFIAIGLEYDNKKPSAKCRDACLEEILPEIEALGITNLIVTDAVYFQKLAGGKTLDSCLGTTIKYNGFRLFPLHNYQALIYNPGIQAKIDMGIKTFVEVVKGNHVEPGSDVLKTALYPKTLYEISQMFQKLLQKKYLAIDIEGLSLDFWTCGIQTISFAWNEHEGCAIPVDRHDCPDDVRAMLKNFLAKYKGQTFWYNAGFDIKVLTYNLWMKNLGDYKGMLQGLDTLCNRMQDAQLLAYLCTNNAVQNQLSLKEQALPYLGNYGLTDAEIKDVSKVPINKLLDYNLRDVIGTLWVWNQYVDQGYKEDLMALYHDIFIPAVKTLAQTELCGLPIDPEKVQEARAQLEAIVAKNLALIFGSKEIQDYHAMRLQNIADAKTAKAKKKVYTVDDPVVAREVFNPNSDQQLAGFLYDYLGYPVLDVTKSKAPSTAGKTLKKLMPRARTAHHLELLKAFEELSAANIILTTFIPAFERAQQLPDGSWRFYGNFRLGGTISLRLSSSKPNLMNLPSNSTFAPLIKACFVSTGDWLFFGSDFDSLEDKIKTLQTRDPNMMKIYIDGYDGHCLRAYNYWPDKFPDIEPDDPNSVNTIKTRKTYKPLRKDSKAPSFALNYQGTWRTLVNNCGFSEPEAKKIEAGYHKLYEVSDLWTAEHLYKARINGYVPLAFNGRLRTPLLARAGQKKLNFLAEKEGRSAGNALTQCYCILTLRALNEFMQRVWDSEYRYDILPAITIHDANYGIARNKAGIVEWVNRNLIECMMWNKLSELQHDIVKITASMDIHYKNWNNALTLPHNATTDEIVQLAAEYRRKIDNPQPTKAG